WLQLLTNCAARWPSSSGKSSSVLAFSSGRCSMAPKIAEPWGGFKFGAVDCRHSAAPSRGAEALRLCADHRFEKRLECPHQRVVLVRAFGECMQPLLRARWQNRCVAKGLFGDTDQPGVGS